MTPDIVQQYDEFTAKTKQQWSTTNEEASAYDMDEAAAAQAKEDALMDDTEQEAIPATGAD